MPAEHGPLQHANAGVEKRALRIAGRGPRWVPNPARQSRFRRALLLRVSRDSEVAANDTHAADGVMPHRDARIRHGETRAMTSAVRVGSSAGAMRSMPTRREAGKRARRFLAASPVPVIRVVQRHARRISAPGICRPHASVLAATASENEPRALSRHAERRQPTSLLAPPHKPITRAVIRNPPPPRAAGDQRRQRRQRGGRYRSDERGVKKPRA